MKLYKAGILLMAMTLIACGKDSEVGVVECPTVKQVPIEHARLVCSSEAYDNRCTAFTSKDRLMPHQFYSHYCYQQYARCVRGQR